MNIDIIKRRARVYRDNGGDWGKPISNVEFARRIISSEHTQIKFNDDVDSYEEFGALGHKKIDAGWPITGERIRVFCDLNNKASLAPDSLAALVDFLRAEGYVNEADDRGDAQSVAIYAAYSIEFWSANTSSSSFDEIIKNIDFARIDARFSFGVSGCGSFVIAAGSVDLTSYCSAHSVSISGFIIEILECMYIFQAIGSNPYLVVRINCNYNGQNKGMKGSLFIDDKTKLTSQSTIEVDL